MYQIKQVPEDFIVNEISDLNKKIQNNGQYAYYTLEKTSLTTIDSLQILSKKFKIPLKKIGFAGNKDKNAITEQKISIFNGSKKFENYDFKNIKLKYLGNGNGPISLGNLEGNEFTITIRNIGNGDIGRLKNLLNKKISVPNIYGLQRFGKNNYLVGRAIIKKEFKKAVELIIENSGRVEQEIRDYFGKSNNNYVGALRLIPLKTRKLFVHAYQSFLFNKIILQYLKNNNDAQNIKIPIIGFDFELRSIKNKELKNIIKKIIDEEQIVPRDFIIAQMPELTSEGGSRDLFFEFDFKILGIGNDEFNKNMRKITIQFTLPKSCYATTALEFIFR